MLKYIAERLFQAVLVVFLISVATFVMMRLIPGDPILLMIGGEGQVMLSPADIAAIRAKWGLDLPWHEQYLSWAYNMIRGNWGVSIFRVGVPVRDMLLDAAQVTAILSLSSVAIALLIAIPSGIIAGVKRNSFFDHLTTFGVTLGVAIPNFWFALMAIVIFALILGWVPPFGIREWQGWILPVVVLATEQTAVFGRVMRGSIIEVLDQDYIRTAYAKGLTRTMVVSYHAVRNALLPVVTVIGFRIAFILSGTIIVETVFALPGIGSLFMTSIARLDFQVVQSIVLILAILVVVVNLLTDLLYSYIDPRIRVQG